jgi:hypothetical protein
MGADLDGHIGAGDGADAAPDAPGRFMQAGVKIPFEIYIFRHGQNLHGTGPDAQLAALAIIFIYPDTRHGLLALPWFQH